jgi:ribokinase
MSFIDNYVLVIGSSNIDLNIYSNRFPTVGETVTGGKFTQSFGGKGANQAVASIRSGSQTFFIGKVGEDPFGNQMLLNLKNEGINVDYVVKSPDNASGVAFILVDSTGNNMISVAPGANEKLMIHDIIKAKKIIQNASIILVQMEIPMETIKKTFDIASKKTTIKILNPAPLKPIPLDVLDQTDIITPNENELLGLHSLLGLSEVKNATKEKYPQIAIDIHAIGVKTIITTLGERGCFIYEGKDDEGYYIPAFKVKAIDTVGAGDCFNGVLASRLAKGDKISKAARYANAAASIAVSRRGAQNSMPFETEIEKRYNKIFEKG